MPQLLLPLTASPSLINVLTATLLVSQQRSTALEDDELLCPILSTTRTPGCESGVQHANTYTIIHHTKTWGLTCVEALCRFLLVKITRVPWYANSSGRLYQVTDFEQAHLVSSPLSLIAVARYHTCQQEQHNNFVYHERRRRIVPYFSLLNASLSTTTDDS
jgi:hypothetical protein